MKYVQLTCSECRKEFEKDCYSYNKRLNKGINRFYCSRSCGATQTNKTKSYEKLKRRVKVHCSTCNKEFDKQLSKYKESIKNGQNKFYCCRSCAITPHNPPKEYIILVCSRCGQEFERLKSRHSFNIKRGCLASYCSQGCGAADRQAKRNASIHSPFRLFIHKAKNNGSRRRVLEFNITPEYLKELWDIQNGICPLSGWHLRLPRSSQKWEKGYAYSIDNASLDRIDNSKGYMIGNVRFVALITNFARNKFTDEEVIKFGKAVAEYNKST